ncbi:hypothetical protein FGO68_gene6231 [Halteria grandinella]|uniref:Uncharacterized protein n=1 Tax=Halteria grandinella TaxID=5974 RepID=A0A8J8NVJ4_HALGN|nr:hypothetical protein FGO68_gene6231 [Halteria grandinella]
MLSELIRCEVCRYVYNQWIVLLCEHILQLIVVIEQPPIMHDFQVLIAYAPNPQSTNGQPNPRTSCQILCRM